MSEVKKFQLVNGLDVIGKVIEETDATFTTEHALLIRVVQQGSDQFGLALVPFDPSHPEGKMKFYRNNVVCEVVDLPDGMVKAYLERTSSIQIIQALDQMEGFRK